MFDAKTRSILRELRGHKRFVLPRAEFSLNIFSSVQATRFSPDNIHVVSGADDNTVRYWDLSTAQELATLNGHKVLTFHF